MFFLQLCRLQILAAKKIVSLADDFFSFTISAVVFRFNKGLAGASRAGVSGIIEDQGTHCHITTRVVGFTLRFPRSIKILKWMSKRLNTRHNESVWGNQMIQDIIASLSMQRNCRNSADISHFWNCRHWDLLSARPSPALARTRAGYNLTCVQDEPQMAVSFRILHLDDCTSDTY